MRARATSTPPIYWSAYQIWKEHPRKKGNKVSVQRLLKRFHEHGSMNRRPGSGRPRTAMTEDNEPMIEDLVCSQEEKPGSLCHRGKSKNIPASANHL